MLAATRQQKYCDQGRSTAVDNHVAKPPGAKLLGRRREGQVRVDLAFPDQADRLRGRVHDEADVPLRVHSDVGQHRGDERLRAGPAPRHGDGPSPQVTDCADPVGSKELETPGVNSGHEHDRRPPINLDDERGDEPLRDVDLARAQPLVDADSSLRELDVLHAREAFGSEQLLGNVLGARQRPGS